MISWEFLKRFRFSIPCILFELQSPDIIWNGRIRARIAYRIHDFLCPEMWMLRIYPKYLNFDAENNKEEEHPEFLETRVDTGMGINTHIDELW